MKKTILTKAVSALLCASMALAFASCAATGKTEPEDTKETAAESKPEAEQTSESSEETTVETTLETTETSETTTEAATTTTAPKVNPYERFIADYQNSIMNPTDTWYYGPDYEGDTVIPPEGTVGLLTTKNGDYIAYTLLDIDKDGTDELIFGYVHEQDGVSYINVEGLVTMTGEDEYKIVAAGWERSNLTYVGGCMFVNSGSGGAALHIDTIYKYNSVTKEMDTVCELITEYEGTDDNGIPIPKYSLFEGDNYHFTGSAYDSDAATCHDQEAMDKFTQTKDAAMANVKDIPEQIEWTMVPIK